MSDSQNQSAAITFNLKDRRVIVTGGGRGIGGATVDAFLAAGASVYSLDLDHQGRTADRLLTRDVDLASETTCRQAVSQAIEELGGLNTLVCCVAAQSPASYALCDEVAIGPAQHMFNVNFWSYAISAQVAITHFLRNGGGSIVFVSSVQGLAGQQKTAVYSAGKAAINNFTQTLAFENAARGIRVNAVLPACIDTPLVQASFEAGEQGGAVGMAGTHPIGRIGRPEEVAEGVLFLSCASQFLNGVLLPISGAAHCRPAWSFGPECAAAADHNGCWRPEVE